jgi:G3E family GTPase
LIIPGRDPVPVTLLTGFLGAGKTTLLNHILNGQHGLRVGVMVNDFGDINIDAKLIEGVQQNTISLTNGCVCCEIRDDLVDSLEQLLSREEAVDYVILEASGVADPEGIVMTFLSPRYEGLLRLDSIICVIDAVGIFADGDNDRLNVLKLRQMAFADVIVLNKTDLVTSDHIEVIREWIDVHMKRIPIIEAAHGDVPIEFLVGVGRFDPAEVPAERSGDLNPGRSDEPSGGHEEFDRWSYTTAEPLSLDALRRMVQRDLPESVYRCKGILYTADAPERRLSLQIVGRRIQIDDLGYWDERPRLSQIVTIGRGVEHQQLSDLFDACRHARSR